MAYSYKDLYDLYKDDKKVDNVPQSGGAYTFDVLSDIYSAGVTDDNEDYASQLFDPKNVENYKAQQIESDAINQNSPPTPIMDEPTIEKPNEGFFSKLKNAIKKNPKKVLLTDPLSIKGAKDRVNYAKQMYNDQKKVIDHNDPEVYEAMTPYVLERMNFLNQEFQNMTFEERWAGFIPTIDPEKRKKRKEDHEYLQLISEEAEMYNKFLNRSDVKSGFFDGLKESILDLRFLPFGYNAIKGERDKVTKEAIEKLEEGERELLDIKTITDKYHGGDVLNKNEIAALNLMSAKMIDSRIDRGIPYAVGEMMPDMARYGYEFLITKGAAKGALGASKLGPAVNKVTKILPKRIAGPFMQKLTGELAESAVQTGINFPALSEKAAGYALPEYEIMMSEDGEALLKEASKGDDPTTAFRKAFLSSWVEHFSERVGDLTTKGGSAAYKGIVKRMGLITENPEKFIQKALIGKAISKSSNKSINFFSKYLKKSGFDGLLMEILEEEINEPVQAKIDGRKYYSPLTPEGAQRLMMEVIGIGMYGGLLKIPDKTVNAAYKWREKRPEFGPIDIPIDDEANIPPDRLPSVIKEELEALGEENPVDIDEGVVGENEIFNNGLEMNEEQMNEDSQLDVNSTSEIAEGSPQDQNSLSQTGDGVITDEGIVGNKDENDSQEIVKPIESLQEASNVEGIEVLDTGQNMSKGIAVETEEKEVQPIADLTSTGNSLSGISKPSLMTSATEYAGTKLREFSSYLSDTTSTPSLESLKNDPSISLNMGSFIKDVKIKDLAQVYDNVGKITTSYIKTLEDLPGSPTYDISIKEPQSLLRKLATKRSNDTNYSISKINDVIRSRVVYSEEVEIESAVQKFRDAPYKKDYFTNPDAYGYRAFHIGLNINGVPAEIQFHTPKSKEIDEIIRPVFDATRGGEVNRVSEKLIDGTKRIADMIYSNRMSVKEGKREIKHLLTKYGKNKKKKISNEQYQALLGGERSNVPTSNREGDYQGERKEEKVSRENEKGRQENISLASQNNNEKSNKQNIQEKSRTSSSTRTGGVVENREREFTEGTRGKETGKQRGEKVRGGQGYATISSLKSKGTTSIDEYELRESPKPGTREFKIYQRIQSLLKSYDKDFTVGEKYLPRGALGVYYPSTKNIRVDSINSLSVFAHEFTHYLDAKYKITVHLSKPELNKELSKIYVQYYPGAKAGHNSRLKQLEGFATLLQKYVEFPTTTETEYPLLVNEFLKPKGEYYEPTIGKMLKDLNQLVADYQGLESLDKIGTRVSSDDTGIDRKSFFTSAERLRQQLADKVYPLEVIAKKAGLDNKSVDPSLWARAYSAVNGIVGNNISTKRGYWAFTDLESGFQKKYEYNWKTLIDRLEKNNRADSFGYYLVARRQHFLYKELDLLGNRKGQLEVIVKALNKITEPNKLSAFNRDLKSMLEEDYGIEIIPSTIKNGKPEYTAKNLERFKRETNRLLQKLEKEYEEFKSVLDNDGFSRQVVDDAYKQNSEAYEYEEKMFDSLVKADLELLHNPEVQLIDKATFDKLNNTQGYASFKRQFYDELVGETDIPSTSKVKKTKISSLMRRTGSERTIINPIYSSMINHSEIVRKSMRQVVYNRIGSLGSSAAIPNIFQEQELKIHYDKNSEKVTYPQEKDPNIIMARLNYKRQPILVNKEVKTIIDDILDYKSIGKFSKLYLSVSRMFTLGTTGAFVPFTVTNFFMDQVTASMNSYNKFIPLYSPFSTYIKQKINKNSIESKYYEEYLVIGGERQTFMGWQKMSPSQLFDKIKSEKSLIDKAASIGSKALDILQKPAAASEIITRAAEYVAARKAGKSQVVALEEAGRVTAPFHHTGVWGSTSHDITGAVYIRGLPFFNASLQVLDQLARVSTTSSGRKRIMFVGLVLMAAYLASLDYLFRNASDDQKEQYKGLAPEELANFIYFPNPSGKGLWRFRVPAPITIPATVLNMIVSEAMFDTKYDSDEYIDLVTSWIPDQFNLTEPTKAALAWVPQFFKPTTHVIFNVKEYPEVRPLVNQGLSNRPNAEQYNEGTTPLAKKLGEMMNLSPIKIDYFVTGTFGRASKMLMGQPENLNPLTAFQRDYWLTSDRRITDFYNTRDENDKKYSSVQNHRGEYENITEAEIKEIYRIKAITDDVENLLDEFREVDIEKNQDEASKLRSKILTNVEGLENPKYYPKDFVEWSEDRTKTRYKNKSKK